MSLFEYFSGMTHEDVVGNKKRINEIVKKVNEWSSFSSKGEFDTFMLLTSSELNETIKDFILLLKTAVDEKRVNEKIIDFINEQFPEDSKEEQGDELPPKREQKPEIAKPEIAKPDDAGGPDAEEEDEVDEPETDETAEELPEIELLGLTQDIYYTLIRKTNDAGEVDDMIVQDQEENELLSAKDSGIDINDNSGFIRLAIDKLDMEWADPEVLKRHKLLRTEEDELEDEEGNVPGEIPQEIPQAETKAGEVGGSQMVAPFESVRRIREGIEDVMKKAGVDTGAYLNTGKAVYFRGVKDDDARAIADALVGSIVGTVALDGMRFYKLMLESASLKEGYTIIAADIADEETAKKLATEKEGFSIPDPNKENSFLVLKDEEEK